MGASMKHKTKIIMEIESDNKDFIQAAGEVLVSHARDAMKYFVAVTGDEVEFNMVKDGVNVTETVH